MLGSGHSLGCEPWLGQLSSMSFMDQPLRPHVISKERALFWSRVRVSCVYVASDVSMVTAGARDRRVESA